MRRKYNELLVGILTIVAIVVLVVGMLWFKNVDLSKGEKLYQIDFAQVEGLRAGDKVQVRGIRMGEVKGLTMLAAAVRVEISLDESVLLTETAVVTLGEKGIVGEVVIEIDPGVGQVVDEGHIFRGRTTGTIAAMTDAAGAALEEMLIMTKQVTVLVDEIKTQGKVVETLASANSSFKKFNEFIDEDREDFSQALDNLVVATEGLRTMVESERMEGVIDNAANAFSKADSMVTTLNTAAERLDRILIKIDDDQGSLGRLLNDPLLYDRADSTMASVKRLVDAMRRNPKRYFNLKVVDF